MYKVTNNILYTIPGFDSSISLHHDFEFQGVIFEMFNRAID